MPSPQMQEVINRLRQRRATPSSQPPQTYEEILGPYSLADQVNPLPADVSVTDLNANGVPSHWLHIHNDGDDRVLMAVDTLSARFAATVSWPRRSDALPKCTCSSRSTGSHRSTDSQPPSTTC